MLHPKLNTAYMFLKFVLFVLWTWSGQRHNQQTVISSSLHLTDTAALHVYIATRWYTVIGQEHASPGKVPHV